MAVLGDPLSTRNAPAHRACPKKPGGQPRNSHPRGGHPCREPGENSPLASCRQADTLGLAVYPGTQAPCSAQSSTLPCTAMLSPPSQLLKPFLAPRTASVQAMLGSCACLCTDQGTQRRGHPRPRCTRAGGQGPRRQGPWGTMGRASSGVLNRLASQGVTLAQRRGGQTPGREAGLGRPVGGRRGVMKDLAAAGWVQSRRRQERPQPPGLESAEQGASPGGPHPWHGDVK